MKHLFIPYEIAKQLKEKGFNEKCMAFYAGNPLDVYKWKLNITSNNWNTHKNNTTAIIAPLYQQVIDWFRVKHNLYIEINSEFSDYTYMINSKDNVNSRLKQLRMNFGFKEYYETLNKAIEEALKLI